MVSVCTTTRTCFRYNTDSWGKTEIIVKVNIFEMSVTSAILGIFSFLIRY